MHIFKIKITLYLKKKTEFMNIRVPRVTPKHRYKN